jgi:hypothetical protein
MLLQGMITTHSRTWKEQFLQCAIKKISTLPRRTGKASVGKKYKNTKVILTI